MAKQGETEMRKSALAVVVLLFALVIPPVHASTVKDITVPGGPLSAIDPTPVDIDARLYLPDSTPAPAVVLAHGFGGSKEGLATQAERLQAAGFVVITYSARGFGKTRAAISMNSPQYEVADAKALIDYASSLREVSQESPKDPKIGFAGSSYGGALSLLVAGQDARVDAIVSDITYNSLQNSLFPQGVFKQQWTANFFSVGMATPPQLASPCGRFSLDWCQIYNTAATRQPLTPEQLTLMNASSPASVAGNITAATLLVQGQADSLFPLSEADATFTQIKTAQPATPLAMVWQAGGHDGGVNEFDRLVDLGITWFNKHLNNQKIEFPEFQVSYNAGSVINSSRPSLEQWSADTYRGLISKKVSLPISGETTSIVAPAGGQPANISVFPGIGGIAGLLGRTYPNQSVSFDTEPVTAVTRVVGSSSIKLNIASVSPSESPTFFVSLSIVTPAGKVITPQGLTTPIAVQGLADGEVTVDVALPAIVAQANPGDKFRVTVTTTDAAYALPVTPAVYSVSLADSQLLLATHEIVVVPKESSLKWLWFAAGAVLLTLIVLFLTRKRSATFAAPIESTSPVTISHLQKQYKNGYLAVDDVTWEVPAGHVIGLLGPNGAGKTTTMRMIMGLITPTAGTIHIFGEPVTPGAPVLARVGALVEGAGFLPHLSGRTNLELFWKASGRSRDESFMEQVLEIADLGTAIDRKVKTYSQGMRQRLGIAQAMLGMPDILMLDEPTNGLDPQQIKAMRSMMKDYAATGRTVLVSSHMLSEVQQTCSHVVVMHRGKIVTTGEVDEILSSHQGMSLEDFFLDIIGEDLTIGKD